MTDPLNNRIILLDKALYGLVCAIALMLPFAFEPLKAGLLIATAIVYIVRRIAMRDYHLPASPLNLPMGCLLALNLASVLTSQSPMYSLDGFRGEPLKYGIIYLAALDAVRTTERVRGIIYAVLIATAVLGLVGVPGWLFTKSLVQIPGYDQMQRAVSLNGSYTYLALYLIIGLSITVAVRPSIGKTPAQRAYARSALDLSTLAGLACVVLTFTRGAWVALGFAILILSVFLRRKGPMIVLGIFAVVFFLFASVTSDRLMTILDFHSYATVAIPDRLPNWKLALSMIRDHPVTGAGCGQNIMEEVYRHNPRYQSGMPADFKPLPDAHNVYLQMLLETGIPGLFSLFWLFLAFLIYGWPKDKSNGDTLRDNAFFGLSAAIAALCIYGLVGHFWNDEISQSLTLLMVTLCSSSRASNGQLSAQPESVDIH